MRLYMVWEFRPILSKFSKSVTNEFGRKRRGEEKVIHRIYITKFIFPLLGGK